jgi:hypothetical protein
MSTTEDDPIPENAFAALQALLLLITDEKACGRRLAQLRNAQDALDRDRRALDEERASHADHVRQENSRLDGRRTSLANLIEQYERALETLGSKAA